MCSQFTIWNVSRCSLHLFVCVCCCCFCVAVRADSFFLFFIRRASELSSTFIAFDVVILPGNVRPRCLCIPLSSFRYDYFSSYMNVSAFFFLLNFYVHIHRSMACININYSNFVSTHFSFGISFSPAFCCHFIFVHPLYVPSLCDIFSCKIVSFFRHSCASFRFVSFFSAVIASHSCDALTLALALVRCGAPDRAMSNKDSTEKRLSELCARNANFE